MASLADQLTNASARPVVDRTGLPGLYDVTLSRYPHQKGDPDPPSVYDVEQSGFAFKPVKTVVDTIVVDHIEKPTAN